MRKVSKKQQEYDAFLVGKVRTIESVGIDSRDTQLNPAMARFQKLATEWAVRLGRAAQWADTGLGKTFMLLEWASIIASKINRPGLILCPLAVGPQTIREAAKFDIPGRYGLSIQLAESSEDIKGTGLYVTNYAKLDKFDTSVFGCVALDESSILKNYTGKTKEALCERFANTPYRLACTATPAPNDYMEIGNHAEFLSIMPSSEMLARWFITDQGSGAGKYRLKGHAEEDFWRWVASWACCITKPSDLTEDPADDAAYELPALNLMEHIVSVDITEDSGDLLFRGDKLTATSLHKELRRTVDSRAGAVAKLINADRKNNWLIWCNSDYEADALTAVVKEAVEVRGSQSDSTKEKLLTGFSNGEHRILITKPSVAGFGLNWQHCHKQAFIGLSYSFEQFYQALRRCWRFGQTEEVDAHIFLAETEGEVLATVKRKQADAVVMQQKMVEAVRSHWSDGEERRQMRMSYTHRVEHGKDWELHLGDSVEIASKWKKHNVDFTIFSPPFSNLYIYSDSLRDMGNADDDEEFFKHFGFLVPQLLRITTPGRLCAVHCKDLPLYRGRDDAAGLKDFPGRIIKAMEVGGWTYHSRVTIWKCPVIERERTNNNGLLHKTVLRDSSQIRQGMADYLLVFRKTPKVGSNLSAKPINRPQGFQGFVGAKELDPLTTGVHPSPYARTNRKKASISGAGTSDMDKSVVIWRRYAEPVWWDIDQTDVLNYQIARSDRDEKHICPLQLGLIERAIELWSNPGDTVFSPFAGIGSEGYKAVTMHRKFVGVELKEAYFDIGLRNLGVAEEKARQKGLFDSIPEEAMA